jgi:hypothetical protein
MEPAEMNPSLPRPIWIFDLDGTLALIDHRRPILEDTADPRRWEKFYAACTNDQPNMPVIRIMNMLLAGGHDVRVWSGRSDVVRGPTAHWLFAHTLLGRNECHRVLMRPASDFTPDVDLKRSWLGAMPTTERANIQGVFDDRDSVVAMWRNEGLTCFQVAPGDF